MVCLPRSTEEHKMRKYIVTNLISGSRFYYCSTYIGRVHQIFRIEIQYIQHTSECMVGYYVAVDRLWYQNENMCHRGEVKIPTFQGRRVGVRFGLFIQLLRSGVHNGHWLWVRFEFRLLQRTSPCGIVFVHSAVDTKQPFQSPDLDWPSAE